jgi:Icc protein
MLVTSAQREAGAWLAQELAGTPQSTHVVLASHIPIQTALPFTDASLRGADGSFTVPGGWGVHSDTPEINDLLLDHPNVRLALSGHNHIRDDITYNTVRFANGAR